MKGWAQWFDEKSAMSQLVFGWQTHSVEDMVMLVAGRAGGLKRGNHIATGGAHPATCLISAMQAAGVAGDTLGEAQDRRGAPRLAEPSPDGGTSAKPSTPGRRRRHVD